MKHFKYYSLLIISIVLLILTLSTHPLLARLYGPYNHPELKWYTMTTPHFYIHFHNGCEGTTARVNDVVEKIYPRLSAIYDYSPKRRIHIVIRDTEDYGTGFAYPLYDLVTISATNLHTTTRGRHTWVENVLFHELSHIFSLRVANPFPPHFPYIFLGGLVDRSLLESLPGSLEDAEGQIGAFLHLSGRAIPPWLSEGIAQQDTRREGTEGWDTNRDMMLRIAVLGDNLLTYDEMGTYSGKNDAESEMVYNQGFSLLNYLEDTYSPEVTVRIARCSGSRPHLTLDGIIEKVTNKPGEDIYKEWKNSIEKHYEDQTRGIKAGEKNGTEVYLFGEEVEDSGLMNRHVHISPDKKWMAFASSRGMPYTRTNLYIKSLIKNQKSSKEPEALDVTNSSFSWSPNSKKIVYSRRDTHWWHGYKYNRLYIYDVDKRSSSPIPGWLRATDPAWSPVGDRIAFVKNADGNKNLALINPDGSNLAMLTRFNDGSQCASPSWSPDGRRIAFTLFREGNQDVWVYDFKNDNLERITYSSAEQRDPIWLTGGKGILYASDEGGIFNLAWTDFEDSEKRRLTDVIGGSFWPTASPDGEEIYYSQYTSNGYRIFRIPAEEALSKSKIKNQKLKILDQKTEDRNQKAEGRKEGSRLKARGSRLKAQGSKPEGQGSKLQATTYKLKAQNPEPYHTTLLPIIIVPIVLYEEDQLKLGAEIDTGDYLDRHEIRGNILLGEDKDHDFILVYLNHSFSIDIITILQRYIGYGHGRITVEGVPGTIEYPRRSTTDYLTLGLLKQVFSDHRLSLGMHIRNIHHHLGRGVVFGEGMGSDLDQLRNFTTYIKWHYSNLAWHPRRDINPRGGRSVSLTLSRTRSILSQYLALIPQHLEEWEYEPQEDHTFHRLFIEYNEYLALPWILGKWEHTLILKAILGLTDRNVTPWDEFLLGGRLEYRTGRDHVPFSGMGLFQVRGEALSALGFSYTFPLYRGLNRQVFIWYLDSLYGSFFGNAAGVFPMEGRGEIRFDTNRDGAFDHRDLYFDAGVEFKLKAQVFYTYPWNSYIRLARGFNDPDKVPLRVYVGIGTNF